MLFSFLAGVWVRHMRKVPGGDWILTRDAATAFSSCRLSFLFMMVFQSPRHALLCPLSLERDQRPPAGAVAQSLPLVAHRDLLRSKDDADRLPGVLGIHVAGEGPNLEAAQKARDEWWREHAN